MEEQFKVIKRLLEDTFKPEYKKELDVVYNNILSELEILHRDIEDLKAKKEALQLLNEEQGDKIYDLTNEIDTLKEINDKLKEDLEYYRYKD